MTVKIDQRMKEAIRVRLMYSFGFTYQEADAELNYLLINGYLRTRDSYATVRRIGANKLLNRTQRLDIHKWCLAIHEEVTKGIIEA